MKKEENNFLTSYYIHKATHGGEDIKTDDAQQIIAMIVQRFVTTYLCP